MYICKKCGLKRVAGTREQTRDFVFKDICIRCNKKKFFIINNRYSIYQDGVIYDTEKAKDIPQWIFELRDFILESYEEMKHQIDL